MLATPADRGNYLALHYWDKFDFKDDSLMERPEITEQGFVDFVSILSQVTERKAALAVFASRMVINPKMLEHLLKMSEHYLFDNFSPVYDEELYLMLVEELLKQPQLSLVQKEKLRYQQRMARKNRMGQLATDFSFVLRNGKRMTLGEVKADYVLLFLNDPECSACREVKKGMEQSAIVRQWVESRRMIMLSVCVEGKTPAWERLPLRTGWMDAYDEDRKLMEQDLYDLRNLPAVYLLDVQKKVLLKNATLDKLEQVLARIPYP